MTRNDYSISTIENIIKANTKLVDEKKDLEKQLLEKDIILNRIKEYCKKYIIPNCYNNFNEIVNIIEGKEDEEDEDIFSTI